MNYSDQVYHYYDVGDVIFHQNELAKNAFIIEEGEVEIMLETSSGKMIHLGTCGAGTIIGEMAIIDDKPRTATVKAITPCTLLEITRDDFQSRLQDCDPIIQMVTKVILKRYRNAIVQSDSSKQAYEGSKKTDPALDVGVVNDNQAVSQIRLGHEFMQGLANDHIKLYYQPIIDLQEKIVLGFEALMRWQHPERGFISPAVFIPILEKNKSIVQVSRWALSQSCRALKRIEERVKLPHKLFMGINFSAVDFAADDFVNNLNQTLSKEDVSPDQLHIEITERLIIHQPDIAKESLVQCRQAGMDVAIDDFGTGYSSLSYLCQFPINILKIDQSFVRAMTEDSHNLEIVKAIINLGESLNMKVVAEGIESSADFEILKELKCAQGQGYYFARPAPEDEVIAALENEKVIAW